MSGTALAAGVCGKPGEGKFDGAILNADLGVLMSSQVTALLECGDSSPLSFCGGCSSPLRAPLETGTGTFNAAHWAVWDASDLRGRVKLGSIRRDCGTQFPSA